ncbi:unnamed protein product, partial [marine sediment metagenome]
TEKGTKTITEGLVITLNGKTGEVFRGSLGRKLQNSKTPKLQINKSLPRTDHPRAAGIASGDARLDEKSAITKSSLNYQFKTATKLYV